MLDSHDDFQNLYDAAPDVLYTHDLKYGLIRVNRAFEQVLGYPRTQVLGQSTLDLIAREYHAAVMQSIEGLIGGAPTQPIEVEFLTLKGSRAFLEVRTELIFEHGKPAGVQGFARDITERKRELESLSVATTELREKTKQLAAFNSHLRVLHRLSTTPYTDLDTLFGSYLAAGCDIFNLPEAVVWQFTTNGGIVRAVHGQGVCTVLPEWVTAWAQKTTVISPATDATPYVGTALMFDDKLFGGIGFWSSTHEALLHPNAREIIELMAQGITTALHHRHLSEQLAMSSSQDPLTKVSNRLVLSRTLETALASARDVGSVVAILFIDLDRFKRLNHTASRSIGDAVLEQVGARLQAHMRPGNIVARMGGDEFAVILTDTGDVAQVVAVAHELLDALRAPCQIEGHELVVTASIGISVYPRDGVDAGTLLRNAHAAMSTAEQRGSDNAQLYSTEDTRIAVARVSIANSLRGALDRNELRLLFQPQVDFDGRLAGAEVLLAWMHPELGRVPPSEFIPIAEDTGMILPIGTWVLRESCRQATEWLQEYGVRLKLAVNVSAVQFAHTGFVDVVAAVLHETGLAPELLELEITESLLLRDMDEVAESLRRLRSLGVRVAIDDFGTGYSSLSYIRNLPVDTLKIDRSFLIGLEEAEGSMALLRGIVALGHTLGLAVTAEGVETITQLRFVRTAGCDLAQGHLFGVALDARDMAGVISKPQPVFAAEIGQLIR